MATHRDHPSSRQERLAAIFPAGSEVAALMRAFDWSVTSLGEPEGWPQSLRTMVSMLLTSRYQMWMGWGPDLNFFYNDAYRPTLGAKHPRALGAPTRQIWSEIWDDIGPRIQHVLEAGEATWDEGLLLLLERSGYPEETYHTFSYSPVFSDTGTVGGMLCVVTEETERVTANGASRSCGSCRRGSPRRRRPGTSWPRCRTPGPSPAATSRSRSRISSTIRCGGPRSWPGRACPPITRAPPPRSTSTSRAPGRSPGCWPRGARWSWTRCPPPTPGPAARGSVRRAPPS